MGRPCETKWVVFKLPCNEAHGTVFLMKVCIFGAGAIGSHFAARLSAIGADVSCVARGKQLDAIRENGITLHRFNQETLRAEVNASDDPASLGVQDLVIVSVKSYSLSETVDQMKGLLGPETPIIYAQNGIPWWYFYGLDKPSKERRIESLDPGGRLWEDLGVHRAIGGVVYSANTLESPGVVRNTSPGRNWLQIGEPTGLKSSRIKKIHDVFKEADMGPLTNDIRYTVWDKLMSNMATGSISCLTHSTVNELQQNDGTHALAIGIMREAMAIANSLGTSIDIDPVERFKLTKGGSHKVSMLQDLERVHRMEIDSMVGVPLELAQKADIRVPILSVVVALLKHRAHLLGLYNT